MKKYLLIMLILLIYLDVKSQTTADEHYKSGSNYAENHDWNSAIREFQNAINLYSSEYPDKKAFCYFSKSVCEFQLGYYKDAIASSQKCILLGYYLCAAYQTLGLNYYYNKEYSEAIDAFRSAISYYYSSSDNCGYDISNIYSSMKNCYIELDNKYGWIPATQFWKINVPHAYWEYETSGRTCCINKFAVRVENRLPIEIQAVNIDLIIKDKNGTIVYKRNHTAWVNGLNTNEVAQSDYFRLNNEVCLPCEYMNGEKFSWTSVITGVAY